MRPLLGRRHVVEHAQGNRGEGQPLVGAIVVVIMAIAAIAVAVPPMYPNVAVPPTRLDHDNLLDALAMAIVEFPRLLDAPMGFAISPVSGDMPPAVDISPAVDMPPFRGASPVLDIPAFFGPMPSFDMPASLDAAMLLDVPPLLDTFRFLGTIPPFGASPIPGALPVVNLVKGEIAELRAKEAALGLRLRRAG